MLASYENIDDFRFNVLTIKFSYTTATFNKPSIDKCQIASFRKVNNTFAIPIACFKAFTAMAPVAVYSIDMTTGMTRMMTLLPIGRLQFFVWNSCQKASLGQCVYVV